MEPPENSVEAREASMEFQLAGRSSSVNAEEAEAGIDAARLDLEGGRGAGYGVGFGFVRSLGSPNGLDGLRVEFAVTDGEHVANLHAVVSGSRLATLGKHLHALDEDVLAWMLGRLYEKAGAIPRGSDRYEVLLSEAHPLRL